MKEENLEEIRKDVKTGTQNRFIRKDMKNKF